MATMILLVMAAGCGQINQQFGVNRIAGTWIEWDDNSSMEFLPDGYAITVTNAGRNSDKPLTGTYKYLQDGRLGIDFGGTSGAMIFEVSINCMCGMKLKTQRARKPVHIKRIVEVACIAKHSDSPT